MSPRCTPQRSLLGDAGELASDTQDTALFPALQEHGLTVLQAPTHQTLEGSFSAVSEPIFVPQSVLSLRLWNTSVLFRFRVSLLSENNPNNIR